MACPQSSYDTVILQVLCTKRTCHGMSLRYSCNKYRDDGYYSVRRMLRKRVAMTGAVKRAAMEDFWAVRSKGAASA